jgi:hypothetical protein
VTIVHTTYRYRPPPKRKQPVKIPNRIVSARAPQTSAPAVKEAVPVRKPPAQAAAITGPRIVTAKKPRPKSIGPEQIAAAMRDSVPADPQAAAVTAPRIVTASPKRMTRFEPVHDIDAEEHQRRGDAAEALFKELVRRATWNAGS